MSILNRLWNQRGEDSDGMEKRTLTSSSFVPPPSEGFVADYVGANRAMSSMTVYGCVRLLADTIASLPWKAYRRDSNGIPVELPSQPAIVRQPYPGFDLYSWKWMVVASLALRGNSFHLVTSRDNLSYPTGLLPLHPDVVYLERRPDILRWFDPIYRVLGEPVPSEDMVHIRRFTVPGDPWGLSPIKQAASAIGMSLSAEEYGYRYFREAANPSGVLSTDQNLDEASIERQQKNWISSHQGRRMPAILTGGLKWQNISISPEESQFLQTRGFQREEIMMLFGIPPHMLGLQEKNTAWGSGLEQMSQGFVTYTLRAWTSAIESVISSCLPRGQFVRFDFTALLRGDTLARYESYQKALQSAWMSPNEIRAHEELEPIEGGDTYLQPVTMAPLGFIPKTGGGDSGESDSGESDTEKAPEPSKTPPGPSKTTTAKTISGGESDGSAVQTPRNGSAVKAGR